MKTADAFWMVWNANGGKPTFKHPTEESARLEAERLARLNRGQVFIVLESKAQCVVTDVAWFEHDRSREDVPF